MRVALLFGISLLALGACGADERVAVSAPRTSTPPTADRPAANEVFLCSGQEVPLERLLSPRPATDLSPSGQEAVRHESVRELGDLSRWIIVEDKPEIVSIIREIPDPQPERGSPGVSRTHEVVVIKDVDAPNVQGWFMTAAGSCELRRTFGDLRTAGVRLDPESPLLPGEGSVRLLVHENTCASGRPATGRIRVPLLEPAADGIRIAIGTVARAGNQNCQGNPETPYTLELPEPPGDRPLIDASVYPEREITASGPARAGR